jgi:CHAD domain-containing protein
VELGAWLREPPAGQPVRDSAAAALARRRAKVLKTGRDLEQASDEALHHLRIATKKLRYASDAFAGLYRRKRAAAFLEDVKALQDQLGLLNDTATAGPLAESLPLSPQAALAAGRLLGGRTALRREEVRKAALAFARLRQSRPFWRR